MRGFVLKYEITKYGPTFFCIVITIIKRKTKHTTLSYQFQDQISKS